MRLNVLDIYLHCFVFPNEQWSISHWSEGGSVAPAVLSLNPGLKCGHWHTRFGFGSQHMALHNLSLPYKSESIIPSPAHIKITAA